ALNPAYEGGEAASSGPTSTADAAGPMSTPLPTDDPPVDTGASESPTGSTSSSGADTMVDTGATEDTGPEDPPPPQVGPYQMPQLLPFNDPSADDDDPTLTEDQLELFFASYRVGGVGN